MKIRSAYEQMESKPVIDCSNELTMTEQHHKKATDVNNIIKKYAKTGVLQKLNTIEGIYGDVTGHDFQSAVDLVASAQNMFAALPSEVRAKFQNNPALFLDFADNPDNREQLVEMRLATRREYEETEPDQKRRASDKQPQAAEQPPAAEPTE